MTWQSIIKDIEEKLSSGKRILCKQDMQTMFTKDYWYQIKHHTTNGQIVLYDNYSGICDIKIKNLSEYFEI